MDLGIRGRSALLMASSQGLGRACAEALAAEGCAVTINGRDEKKLARVAGEIADRYSVPVNFAAGDVTTDEGRQALLDVCPEPDILVTNNSGPPPGKLEDWDHTAWISALESNMLAQVLMIRAVVPGMRERRFGRIVNITSAMVKAPIPMMGLSTAARTGLVAFCKSLSREIVIDNVTINNLLPERIDTPRQQFMAERIMSEQGCDLAKARSIIADTIAAKRLGRPEEFASACAFLCAQDSGFISGQNLQIDGGSYVGLI